MSETNNGNLFIFAGVAALAAMTVNVLDVALGFGTDVVAYGSRNAAAWFALFAGNTFRAMYELGLFNMIYMICMLPVFYALRSAHRGSSRDLASFALIAAIVGMAIYIANNAAIPMAVLAGRHEAADTDIARSLYLAAAEATLARGEDFTPAALPGMVVGGCASILAALVMLRGKVFSALNAWIGLVGFTFLMIFTFLATFVPAAYTVTFYLFGMCGGLLALAWFLMTALRFFRLARRGVEA